MKLPFIIHTSAAALLFAGVWVSYGWDWALGAASLGLCFGLAGRGHY